MFSYSSIKSLPSSASKPAICSMCHKTVNFALTAIFISDANRGVVASEFAAHDGRKCRVSLPAILPATPVSGVSVQELLSRTLIGRMSGILGKHAVTEPELCSSRLSPGWSVRSHAIRPLGRGSFIIPFLSVPGTLIILC